MKNFDLLVILKWEVAMDTASQTSLGLKLMIQQLPKTITVLALASLQ